MSNRPDNDRPALIRDLLSSDGQRRPGDDEATGLGAALRTLPEPVWMAVASALYGRAEMALSRAESAEEQAVYTTPEEYRSSWLEHAERAARLWREACHVQR